MDYIFIILLIITAIYNIKYLIIVSNAKPGANKLDFYFSFGRYRIIKNVNAYFDPPYSNQYIRHYKRGRLMFLLFIAVITSYGLFLNTRGNSETKNKKDNINIKYFSNFNESFKGVIISIDTVSKHEQRRLPKLMLVKIELSYTSCMHYSPEDTTNKYFCLIDYPYAELIIKKSSNIVIGDSLVYRGIKDRIYIKHGESWCKYEPPSVTHSNIEIFKSAMTIPKYSEKKFEERQNKNSDLEAENKKATYTSKENVIENKLYVQKTNVNKHIIEYYMIQIGAYSKPVSIETLKMKYKEEVIIMHKENKMYKYFINKKFSELNIVKKYINVLIQKYNIKEQERPFLKKINNNQ